VSDRHLLYVIGQPGSGKSTLVAGLTDGLDPAVETKPFAHTLWRPGVVELGCRRDTFSGTDALGMSVQPKALAWLAATDVQFVLGEGDRLGNLSFLTAARDLGWHVVVLRLTVSAAVAEHRRLSRAAALGTKPQDATWLKGRVSKVRNVADGWDGPLLEVDADQRPESVLDRVRAAGNPVVTMLVA
jgi:hypothetical protein